MRQQRPRKDKPLLFDLRVHDRDHSIVDVKDHPITKWHEVMDILEHKNAIPEKSAKRNIIEMLEKRL